MLKERQTTFSLEKLIKKYPIGVAFQIWKSRQNKWKESLQNRSTIQKYFDRIKMDWTYSKDFEEYCECYLKKYTKESISKNKQLNDIILKKYSSKNSYIDFYVEKYKNYCNFVVPKEFIKPIKFFKSDIENKIGVLYNPIENHKSRYGYTKKVSEGLLRSSYEINFYDLLKENDIKFELEKHYTNSRMRCDFYIPSKNMYIEIAGLKGNYEYDAKMIYKEFKFGAIILLPQEFEKFIKEIKC